MEPEGQKYLVALVGWNEVNRVLAFIFATDESFDKLLGAEEKVEAMSP